MNLENLDIRKAILESGLSQIKIASRLRVTPQYLSRCMRYPLKPEMKNRIIRAISGKDYRILTLEEVLNSGNKLMWLQYKSANTPEHYEIYPDSPYDTNNPGDHSIRFHSGRVQVSGGYGKYWRCWTEKPSVADAMDWD